MKAEGYLAYELKLLKIKPWLTIGSVALNVGIFGYAAVNAGCLRGILNSMEAAGRGSGILGQIAPYLLFMAAAAAVRCLCIWASSYVDALRSFYFQEHLRLEVMGGLFSKEQLKQAAANAGRVFERMDDDIPAVTFPAELLTEVAGYVIFTVMAVGSLMAVNWKITVFLFFPLSLGLLFVKQGAARIQKSRRSNRDIHEEITCSLADVAGSVLSIKALHAEEPVLAHYEGQNEKRRLVVRRDVLFQNLVEFGVDFAVALCLALLMLATAGLAAAGSFPIGDFAIFIYHIDTLDDCILRIIELYTEGKRSEVSYGRIRELKGEKPETIQPELEPLETFSVENLTCIYDNGRGVRGVSFGVKSGELAALTGPVASGKSSVIYALTGMMEKQEGRFLWNQKEITDPFEVMKAPDVVCCMQSSRVLSGSVRENLTLGKGYREEACVRALKDAQLWDEISRMPDGMDTQIGENGVMLSGGQKQRLLLARMLLSNASLYLLDDATSALDKATEEAFLNMFCERIRSTKAAAILVSDREAVLSAADQVVRL